MILLTRRIEFVRKHVRMTQLMTHFGHRYRTHGNMLCPFHEEKNPSAKLYVDQDTFWCWACSPDRAVDVIEYVVLELGLVDDFTGDLPLEKRRAIATLKALSYLEKEFNLSYGAAPWEERLHNSLSWRRLVPPEDPSRYWRVSHVQILRIMSQISTPSKWDVYSEFMRQLLPSRFLPVSAQRPVWANFREQLSLL